MERYASGRTHTRIRATRHAPLAQRQPRHSLGSPDWEKARTMRALREGRASGNVRGACLTGRSDVSVCHEACATGIARAATSFYGVWGSAPAGECRGRGRSTRTLTEGNGGAQPPKAHPIGRRRARCAPYGKGRASGNVKGSCLRANPHPNPRHEAYATGVARAAASFYGVWGSAPAGECRGRGRDAPECPRRETVARSPRTPSRDESGARGRDAPERPRRETVARSLRRLTRWGEGAHDARPTGKAVPAAMSEAHASRGAVTCRFATRHAPPA